ncbi:MAG: TonB-dependent receptor plug domain-containing protein [Rikenellaceae bacterium]
MRKILFLFLCLSLSITTIIAQERPVTGTVIDADGLSLMGAAVIEVGNPANGVTTDLDGKFTINVKNGGAIEVSYIGYITQQINVVGGSNVSVTLVADTEILDEVVVIGYGTQKRSSMTSSIATVSSKDINKQVSSNVAASLQGRAAGVDIVQQGGIAGADVNIVIRGAASLTGTDPLYIVDGVFTNSGLSTINSSDIASLQILKDGAAAAIYGSRAANGVVIITTKSGQKGDVVIDFNITLPIPATNKSAS